MKLYGHSTRTRKKYMDKKLDGNYTKMLQIVLNKSYKQQITNNGCTETYDSSRNRHPSKMNKTYGTLPDKQ